MAGTVNLAKKFERWVDDAFARESVLTGATNNRVDFTGVNEVRVYSVDKKTINNINQSFWSSYASQEECRATIKNVYQEFHYLIDPHTAVGIDVYDKYVISTGDTAPSVAVSTASPFKFNKTVAEAIFGPEAISGRNEFEILEDLSAKTGQTIPAPLRDLDRKPILHNKVCEVSGMKAAVDAFLQ